MSGLAAGMMFAVPTSLPSLSRPTDRNVTGGAFLGAVGSLYADEVTIMLSASNRVVVVTVSLTPAMTTFPVESLVLMTEKATIESVPSRLLVPVQVPAT